MATLGEFSASIADRTNRKTPFRTPIEAIAADGSNVAAILTLLAALEAATQNMLVGVIAQTGYGNIVTGSYSIPTASDAVRSSKLAIVCQDSVTGKFFTRTLAAPLTTLPMLAGTNKLDLAASPTAAFVTAYQNAALSDVGNALTITEIRRSGRALR